MSADGSLRGEPTVTELSRREKQCLALVATGKTSKGAGQVLSLSERTVCYYLHRAQKKLRALNRTNAVAIAIAEQRIPYPQSVQVLPVKRHTNACASGRCACSPN